MKILKILSGLVLCGAASLSFAAEPARTLGDIRASSFRVVAATGGGQYSTGSGWTCGYTTQHAVGATNAHVVKGAKNVVVQYFGDGRPFNVDAQIYRVYDDAARGCDFAFLLMDKKTIALYDPPIIPFAPSARAFIANDRPIASCGCPEAREPMAWAGRQVGEFGTVQTFKPAPRQGQSGSVIAQLNDDGYFEARAILTYLMEGDGRGETLDFDPQIGGALPLANIFDATRKTGAPTLGGYTLQPVAARYELRHAVARSNSLPREVVKSLELSRPALIYIGARWCGPCQRAKPVVERLAKKYRVYIVDADTKTGEKIRETYKITSFPTFVMLEVDADGLLIAERGRFSGYDATTEQKIVDFFEGFKPSPVQVPNRARFPGWTRASCSVGDGAEQQERPEELLDAAERGWTPWSQNDAPSQEQERGETGLISNAIDRIVATAEADVKARIDKAENELRERVKAEGGKALNEAKKQLESEINAAVSECRQKIDAQINDIAQNARYTLAREIGAASQSVKTQSAVLFSELEKQAKQTIKERLGAAFFAVFRWVFAGALVFLVGAFGAGFWARKIANPKQPETETKDAKF